MCWSSVMERTSVSFDPFERSEDLARLAADGYELELNQAGELIINRVPYRTPTGTVECGVLVQPLAMDGDLTINPVADHVIRFGGGAPHNAAGLQLHQIIEVVDQEVSPGRWTNFKLSLLPDGVPMYANYYDQVTAYIRMLTEPAQVLDPACSAQVGGPVIMNREDWPFSYADTASGRSGLGNLAPLFAAEHIAIVGLGGTGSYILDLVAKCPVSQIHLYDGDQFSSHNAFRAPGAPTLEQLRQRLTKVDYFASIYSHINRRIVPHAINIDETNLAELAGATFVFLSMEGGHSKRTIAGYLESIGTPFIDTSLGIIKFGDPSPLNASVSITASSNENRNTFHENVDFSAPEVDNPYADNIQIADLNCLNATMAVIWWKRHLALYHTHHLAFHQRYNVGYARMTSL